MEDESAAVLKESDVSENGTEGSYEREDKGFTGERRTSDRIASAFEKPFLRRSISHKIRIDKKRYEKSLSEQYSC